MARQTNNTLSGYQRRCQQVPTRFISTLLLTTATIALMPVPAKAQTQSVAALSGNFGIPTSSQLFFEEGREQFEQEQRNLTRQHSRSRKELLQIDENVQNSEELRDFEDPRLHRLSDPYPRN
jgi:hypothetical protein